MSILTEITSLENWTKFIRADLHIHSYWEFNMGEWSFDVDDLAMTPEKIVDTAISKNLKIISITDHNTVWNVIKAIKYAEWKDILVIPWVEISTTQWHLLLYFPTYLDLSNFIWKLSITSNKEVCNNWICECLTFAEQNNWIWILAHIELSSWFEQVIWRFWPPIQEIFKHSNLYGLEISSKLSNDFYTDNDSSVDRKSLINLRRSELWYWINYDLPKLMSSDSHTLNKLWINADWNEKVTRIKIDELSFESLK